MLSGHLPLIDTQVLASTLEFCKCEGFLMPVHYNDYVLSTALECGWIDAEQHGRAVAALKQMPTLAALDFLHEQQMLSDDQASALRDAISQAEGSTSQTTGHDAAPAQGPIHVGHTEGLDHVDDYLRLAKEAGASDVHFGVSAPPLIRMNGGLAPMWPDAPPFEPHHTEALYKSFLSAEQIEQLHEQRYLEFSYDSPSQGRFRSSVIQQRKGWDLVFRIIDTKVRSITELGLPETVQALTRFHNGLVLVTGPVGSGKSTTLASMVDLINTERKDHIITLEDPIEYVFQSKGCQVSQREVRTHTESFGKALRGALREDPDVIMVGEMRDLETISLAITASETGHLVLGTLHTSNASRTLDRILDAFPIEQQDQIRIMVAESLRGVVSQQLVPKADNSGRVLALEVLVNTPAVANLIREKKTFMLPGVIQTGRRLGMKLMDDSLMTLVEDGDISGEEAFDRAEQKNLFQRFLK